MLFFQARRIMRQLFDGVAYMHSRDIVHRDLKLENILCIDDERIVISDFGFATKLRKGETLRGSCCCFLNKIMHLRHTEHFRTVWNSWLPFARDLEMPDVRGCTWIFV